jgi:2-polyprenyl-3-methyl-5-hydroxy-6-metoxy-1,4-benzoquinol methylase
MEFSSPAAANLYSDRAVDASWKAWARVHLIPEGKDVIDLGCGGGIYSFGFAELGARSVIGIDASEPYIAEASSRLPGTGALSFRVGHAEQTCLASECADLVFERALIHHLKEPEQSRNALEVKRLLRPGGLWVVQDRTMEDVQSAQPQHWIRAMLFELFPHLMAFEMKRRPSRQAYAQLLKQAGFADVREMRYEEVRKTYDAFEDLQAEILARKGKSILFELSDAELARYCEKLREKAEAPPFTECDAWTVWLAKKDR